MTIRTFPDENFLDTLNPAILKRDEISCNCGRAPIWHNGDYCFYCGYKASAKNWGFVYFIQGDFSKRIKIGFSKDDPNRRMAMFQTGSPERLKLLGYLHGIYDHETALHKYFAEHRIIGEWFDASDELLTWIQTWVYPEPEVVDASA